MKINTLKYLASAALLGAALLPLTAAHADTINQRFHDQRQRIHQGVISGQLTRREQYRLNAREASIRHQEYRDRLTGGRFTPRERHHIQREMNTPAAPFIVTNTMVMCADTRRLKQCLD